METAAENILDGSDANKQLYLMVLNILDGVNSRIEY